MSTSTFQDVQTSRAWQRAVSDELIDGVGSVVAEFFDVGVSRRWSWLDRPEAAALLAAAADPTRAWTVQQARNLAGEIGARMESLRFLLRDRDGKYGDAFDADFEAEELRVIAAAPRAPRMNAHCERIIGSIRREVLDHVLIMGEAHARQVVAAYQAHYNEHRPHQARDQRPPAIQQHLAAARDLDSLRRRPLRTRILGGVINEYRYAA
jgi:transposase InsO family protein